MTNLLYHFLVWEDFPSLQPFQVEERGKRDELQVPEFQACEQTALAQSTAPGKEGLGGCGVCVCARAVYVNVCACSMCTCASTHVCRHVYVFICGISCAAAYMYVVCMCACCVCSDMCCVWKCECVWYVHACFLVGVRFRD